MRLVVTEKRIYAVPPMLEKQVSAALAARNWEQVNEFVSDIECHYGCESIVTEDVEELD